MGGGVEYPVADGKGTIFDDNEEKNDVAVLDTHTFKIKARWPIAPAGEPVGMAMDREHRRLFSAGRNPQFLVVMDADNGKVIQSLPISGGVDGDIFEPETGCCTSPPAMARFIFFMRIPLTSSRKSKRSQPSLEQNDGLRSKDAQPFSEHRGLWCGSSSSNEG